MEYHHLTGTRVLTLKWESCQSELWKGWTWA